MRAQAEECSGARGAGPFVCVRACECVHACVRACVHECVCVLCGLEYELQVGVDSGGDSGVPFRERRPLGAQLRRKLPLKLLRLPTPHCHHSGAERDPKGV
jgi:hypothetical protein